MPDYGHQWTEAQVRRLESRVSASYENAYKTARKTYNDYMKQFRAQDREKRAAWKSGLIPKSEYDNWKIGKVFTGTRWQQMRDVLADDLAKTDLKVSSIINGFLPEAYAENFNFATFQIEKGLNIDTTFTLYDRSTVEYLRREQPNLLPTTKVSIPQSEKWSYKKIQSQVTQSVLLGEPITKLADRLQTVTDMSRNAAVRNARTAMTGAQNAGRIDAYNRAKDMGIKVKQQWVSTLDDRTRYTHVELDGEIVDVGETFSNGCRYPGDPRADPSEVYNCRCTIVPALDGMKNDISDASERANKLDGKSYEEWKGEHKTEEQVLTEKIDDLKQRRSEIEDKTYSGIWRNDVRTSEYEQYKDRIQGKRDYYEDKLRDMDADDPKYALYQQYLKDLDEFELYGAQYAELSEQIKDAERELREWRIANSDPSDMFSQARKDAALWFDAEHGGFRAADAYFDPPSKLVHSGATRAEEHGFYTYTSGSGGHNRPLAGYQKPWSKSGSGWEEEFYVGPNKVWIDFEGKGDDIRGLTTLIEKSTYPDDVWLQSGQGFGTLEGTLGLPRGSMEFMTNEELQSLVGREFELDQFISTAVNEGGGSMFNSKPTKWNVYTPSGSEMLYASDVGAFGKGENEMILQRGGHYQITDAYWGKDMTDGGRRKIFVDMELHPEKGYNKFQQDPTEWKGSRKTYRD